MGKAACSHQDCESRGYGVKSRSIRKGSRGDRRDGDGSYQLKTNVVCRDW
jgi:hypothetical protein